MATLNSITTTYAGEAAGKWVSAALLTAPTLEKNLIEVMPNVKYKSVLQRLSTSSLIQDGSCDFTPDSSVTIDERILTPRELKVNLTLCKRNFHDTWNAIEQGYSAHDVLPKSFADYLLAYVSKKVAAANESSIWNGSSSIAGQFDGFMTLLTTDANLPSANEVSGTTLSRSNILTELGKVADAVPTALYSQGTAQIYVSQQAYRFYMAALGGFGASGVGANGYDNKGANQAFGDLMFEGIKIVPVNGLTANQMLASYRENLVFGTGLLSDQQEVKVIDMSPIDGSDNVRLVMKFTAGVQYVSAADIVTYGITNSAN